jgi:hypothetical protein
MKVHGNKEHGKQRVSDDELFEKVRLQSWFQDHRQRYWVVVEGDADDTEDDDSASGVGLRDHAIVIDDSTDTEDDREESNGTVESDGAEVGESVVREVVEVVVDRVVEVVEGRVDEEVVYSAFDDSEDSDYRESSDEAVEDGDAWARELDVIQGEDGEYEESRIGANDKDDEGLGSVNVDTGHFDIEDEDNINSSPIQKRRAKKRKLRYEWGVHGVVDFDSEDDIRRYLGTERKRRRFRGQPRKKMARFVDSGVMMASSQGDGVGRSSSQVDDHDPPSSPPICIFDWKVPQRPRRGHNDLTSSPVMAADHGRHSDDRKDDLPVFPVHHQTVQSKLEHLEARFEEWCRTCPVCRLAMRSQGQIHQIGDCPQPNTVEVGDHAVEMQQHITQMGGFRGRGGCPWCGIPRAICGQWSDRHEGDEEGSRCQYMDRLVPAVVTMLMDGCPEGWAVFGSWLDRDGVGRNQHREVFEWMRQEAWWEGIQVAHIVRVFHMLVNKNRGVGNV